jgi:DNA-binding MarR family transcriptional regulator
MARRGKSKAQLMDEIAMAFRQAQNRTQVFDELVADRLGINTTDLLCLDLIEQNGRLTAGRLAELAGLTTGAVTGVIDRLERVGYARRLRDESDRRRVLVELTDEAVTKTHAIYGPFKEEWDRLLSRYTADQLQMFIDMLGLGEEVGIRQLEHLRTLGVERLPGFSLEQPHAGDGSGT